MGKCLNVSNLFAHETLINVNLYNLGDSFLCIFTQEVTYITVKKIMSIVIIEKK